MRPLRSERRWAWAQTVLSLDSQTVGTLPGTPLTARPLVISFNVGMIVALTLLVGITYALNGQGLSRAQKTSYRTQLLRDILTAQHLPSDSAAHAASTTATQPLSNTRPAYARHSTASSVTVRAANSAAMGSTGGTHGGTLGLGSRPGDVRVTLLDRSAAASAHGSSGTYTQSIQ